MQLRRPKFSLITASLNSEKYAKCFFKSVLSQTTRNFEHIIIDGGSTDNTLNILHEYKKQMASLGVVVSFISEPDKGLYDALNKGLRKVTGEYVLVVSLTDLLADRDVLNFVENQLENNKHDLAYGNLIVKSEDLSRTIRFWAVDQHPLTRWYHVPPHPTCFIKKEIYEAIGGYKLDFTISADFDLLIRAMQHTQPLKVLAMPRIITIQRFGGLSTKRSLFIRKFVEDVSIGRIFGKSLLASIFGSIGKRVYKLAMVNWNKRFDD